MRVELGNLLENFKTKILGTTGSQLDALWVRKKQDEECATLSIFCPKCRTKHPLREFPLGSVSVCHICAEDHTTENFPSFPRLQVVYKVGFEQTPNPQLQRSTQNDIDSLVV